MRFKLSLVTQTHAGVICIYQSEFGIQICPTGRFLNCFWYCANWKFHEEQNAEQNELYSSYLLEVVLMDWQMIEHQEKLKGGLAENGIGKIKTDHSAIDNKK